jgi:hypothetical protein
MQQDMLVVNQYQMITMGSGWLVGTEQLHWEFIDVGYG